MRRIAVLAVLLALFACNDNNREHPDPLEFTWEFAAGTEGWAGDFADYPMGEEAAYELLFEHDTLPEPLDQTQMALKQSGKDLNRDLFMFIKRKITGLQPNTVYYTTFTVEIASDMPVSAPGATSKPGESVFIKAGASTSQPVKSTDDAHIYRIHFNSDNQNEEVCEMVVIGDYANGTSKAVYTLETVTNKKPFHVTSDPNGELWIIIGADSEFEATTTIYYNKVKVEFY